MATELPTPPPGEPVRTEYGWGYAPPPPPVDPAQAGPSGHYTDTEAGRVDVPIEHANRRRSGLGAGIAAVLALLLKFGGLLLKAKGLLYIFINIGVYAFFFGRNFGLEWALAFGAGILVLLFAHEMGHVIAARIEGIPVSAPAFIPGFGAYITLKAMPRDARSEAILGIGGPIAGTLASLATYGLAVQLGTETRLGLLLAVVAGYSMYFNAINLIPFSPLDGGRILGAVSKWINLLGIVILLAAILLQLVSAVFLILVVILGGFGTFQRFTHPENPSYFKVSPGSRLAIGLAYLALVVVLVYGVEVTSGLIEVAQLGGLK